MGKAFKIIFTLVFGLLIIFIVSFKLEGQELIPSREIEIQGANLAQVALKQDCNLKEKIETGKKLLEASPPLEIVEREQKTRLRNGKYRVTYQLIRKQIALAILDTDTCDVFEARYWLDEEDVKRGNNLRKMRLENPGDVPRFMPVDQTSSLNIVVKWWNNHNSDLNVVESGSSEPSHYIIIGNKFSVSNDNIAYPEEITGLRYSDIIYVPYSDPIHTEEFDKDGNDFMSRNVDEVGEELDDLGIESRAYPGRLVTETITPELVKNILITEQVDPRGIFASDDNGRMLAGRVFVRYATNGEKAFRYTFSKTGASGAGQIMPGTYGTVPGAYRRANLIRDVDIGRVDLKNGIKATFLILDMKLAEIEVKVRTSSKARKIWANKTLEQKHEAVAASYNGGSTKYKHLTGTISLAVQETVDFVRKFKMIRDLRLFTQ